MSIDAKGYAIHSPDAYTDFKLVEYELRPKGDEMVEIAITHCAVCGTDHHVISGEWGPFGNDYIIPGHEIVGKITWIGRKVKGLSIGDRVGVGPQCECCRDCTRCKKGMTQFCKKACWTYGGKDTNGHPCQGGYSNSIRVRQDFVFAIPEDMASEHAAPFGMCGGLTTFTPLKKYGMKEGSRIGVVGIGGLGHFAVLFGVAAGADVFSISHNDNKKEDSVKMGAAGYINTSQKDWEVAHCGTFDIILNTSSPKDLPLNKLMSMLDAGGVFIDVGWPANGWERIQLGSVANTGATFVASKSGNRKDAEAMLAFASKHNIKPWVSIMPMKEAGKAIDHLINREVRYRTVLVQDIE